MYIFALLLILLLAIGISIVSTKSSFLRILKGIRGVVVTGPCFSLTARGSLAKTITYSVWKGIPYAKQWFIPGNPQTTQQVNVRTAMTLLVAEWNTETDNTKAAWDTFADGTGMSGFNKYVSRGMDAYITDQGVDVVPTNVGVVGAPPADVWTWNAV